MYPICSVGRPTIVGHVSLCQRQGNILRGHGDAWGHGHGVVGRLSLIITLHKTGNQVFNNLSFFFINSSVQWRYSEGVVCVDLSGLHTAQEGGRPGTNFIDT